MTHGRWQLTCWALHISNLSSQNQNKTSNPKLQEEKQIMFESLKKGKKKSSSGDIINIIWCNSLQNLFSSWKIRTTKASLLCDPGQHWKHIHYVTNLPLSSLLSGLSASPLLLSDNHCGSTLFTSLKTEVSPTAKRI